MKTLSIFAIAILISLSACQTGDTEQVTTKPIFNEVCPVSGEPVNPKAKTVEHDGKIYGFCCNSCEPKFKADPAKYSAKLSPDGKTFVGEKEPMH